MNIVVETDTSLDIRRVINPPLALTVVPSRNRIINIQNVIMESVREWMKAHGYIEAWYSSITAATGSCEAVGNVFFVAEIIKTLSQTRQLDMEEDIIKGLLARVVTYGPSFRKEHGGMDIQDGRHLNEFLLTEWEAIDMDLDKLIEDNEEMLLHIMEAVLRSRLLEREQHRNLYFWKKHFQKHKVKITYKEAIAELQYNGFSIQYGDDLSSDAERVLTQLFGIVHVTHYPEQIKFFNMYRSTDSEHQGCVECADLLLPYAGETVGMSQRENRYDIIVEKLHNSVMYPQLIAEYQKRGGDTAQVEKDFNRYLDLFKDNDYPRSGAGMGNSRLLQFILSLDRILPW